MEKATLTVSETAQYLGIGINTAYNLVNNKIIPCIKIGRQFRIPKSGLDEWLIYNSHQLK
ncbi:helix-turn-helix domain-containing protein [Propionispora vibrioides]|uniref:DNA binding domain-containing protein, excisionase family n=1 Tax=Propionispora vibrioides TaxID=112903 RepID=A0A1H8U3S6_9FIRM|nr:helix-turn-helix domain-containing protein [Propionispora vibrioides]SEO97308.1 DNA binding domain-containing protein, excisionase family [Propionispora vibrioides]